MRRAMLFILCVLLLTCSAFAEETAAMSDVIPDSAAEKTAAADSAGETPDADSALPEAPAKGYILVTAGSEQLWLPLPAEEDYVFPLTQTLPDGTVMENVLHVTSDGVYMESATCHNQDCVKQGTVTLENRDDRLLYNMIICLPNRVTIQLFTPEEVLAQYLAGQ